jgi:hypothetical protein
VKFSIAKAIAWKQRLGQERHMNASTKLGAGTALAFILCAAIPALHSQEKRITRKELPPAVEKTVQRESAGAQIRGFSTELDHGQRIYEVELMVNGHGKDISIDRQGNIVEVEEEVSMDSLPPAPKAALTQAAGTGTIVRVESLSKLGKLVAYEADVKNSAKRSEIQVGPDGKKLAHEE